MPFIHTSTHVPLNADKELSIESTPKDLRTCAESLRNIADTYAKMADAIESKNIKISSVGGTASIGSFEVDEIDAGRLRVAGLLFDVRAQPASTNTPTNEADNPSYDHPFFVDPAYDEICNNVENHIKQQMGHMGGGNYELEDGEGELDPPVEFSASPENVGEWPEIVGNGEAAVDVNMTYDPNSGQVKFDFKITDVGTPLEDIDYDSESQTFTYFCSTCELEHDESLKQVYNSLCVVTGMISQLQQVNKQQRQGISDAFQTLEDNLRLLAHFVAMHLEENEDDDHEGCDHDHEDDNEANNDD